MPLKERCHNSDSKVCFRDCRLKICSQIPVIEYILGTGNLRSINNLYQVMKRYDLKFEDYV